MSRLKELVTAAKAGIENLTPAEAAAEIDRGDVLLIDVREAAETVPGIVPTAVLVPRGMLELYADAASPEHVPVFDPGLRLILYCSDGRRSALATATLQRLGFPNVADLEGGYRRWVDEGWSTLPPDPRVNGAPKVRQ